MVFNDQIRLLRPIEKNEEEFSYIGGFDEFQNNQSETLPWNDES